MLFFMVGVLGGRVLKDLSRWNTRTWHPRFWRPGLSVPRTLSLIYLDLCWWLSSGFSWSCPLFLDARCKVRPLRQNLESAGLGRYYESLSADPIERVICRNPFCALDFSRALSHSLCPWLFDVLSPVMPVCFAHCGVYQTILVLALPPYPLFVQANASGPPSSLSSIGLELTLTSLVL